METVWSKLKARMLNLFFLTLFCTKMLLHTHRVTVAESLNYFMRLGRMFVHCIRYSHGMWISFIPGAKFGRQFVSVFEDRFFSNLTRPPGHSPFTETVDKHENQHGL